jgi:hypothetical protein
VKPTACAPGRACALRDRAVREGTFVYDRTRAGWFWRDCRTPGRPWTRCPWCDAPLAVPDAQPTTTFMQGDGWE